MRRERHLASRQPPFFAHAFCRGKGQEIAAAHSLVDKLRPPPGSVLTFDALHATRQTMEKIVGEHDADFLIQVKGNAPDLRNSLEQALDSAADTRHSSTSEKGHGRIETRTLALAPISPIDTRWPHTHIACRVERTRSLVRQGEIIGESQETAYYVGSFSIHSRSPGQILQLIRDHWHIENGLHHRKDRSMDEDRNRAAASGIGRITCSIRSLSALVLGRARESLSVIQRTLSMKPHHILRLLRSPYLPHWEATQTVYTLKSSNQPA